MRSPALAVLVLGLVAGCGGSSSYRIPVDSPMQPFEAPEADATDDVDFGAEGDEAEPADAPAPEATPVVPTPPAAKPVAPAAKPAAPAAKPAGAR